MKKIQIKKSNSLNNKIAFIKAIRKLTGLGLKESKDLADIADNDWVTIFFDDEMKNSWYSTIKMFIQDIEEIGYTCKYGYLPDSLFIL